jgi:thioredoxin 1
MSSFQDLISGETPVLVDFFAEWCGPCKMMAPALQAFAQEQAGKLKVIKVDVDKNPAAAAQFQISGVPTLILFHQGKMLWRKSGALPLHLLNQEILPQLPS